ncbi:lipid II:glycine glycyltransferase FemX [Actinospica sp.]|uniref:lipid II:glycine glycyltransferase FemX n=1 Tax=Actinospica sp. TaxID=1872142 RepID=UPI002BE87D70|nr:peptidoglycan bridge formation glycyltransferase FemA/FemB family protein [Actinospica sp.]HWG27248.1 peptidoglycan bridge formation glycyltransferase FemA/FemB family protein [Actinospica sp.]
MSLQVCAIDTALHRRFLLETAAAEGGRRVSFLQSPAWGRVKTAWRPESLGWFSESELVGTALVLYRDLPALPLLGRRSLAYIPEGPTVDWFGSGRDVAAWIRPLIAYLRAHGVFSVKLGPKVVARRWDAASVKAGMADAAYTLFADLPADDAAGADVEPDAGRLIAELEALGWRRQCSSGQGIADVQPRHFIEIPLRGRTPDDVFAGFNTQWRRNVRLAERAGVKVWQTSIDDLPTFHAMYLETAERDRFAPRPLPYFQRMFRELLAVDPDGLRLYLAGADGIPSAAATMVRFGRRAWFGYGAGTTSRRELRAANALQWQMIQDCLDDGLDSYDLRGVGETLAQNHPLFGLLRFKIGTGGDVVEYPGEYDLALNRPLALALRIYLRRR